MKKLIFVRHGKAEEESPGFSDFERSLTSGGKKISRQMARLFNKEEVSPGLLISSPAFRALETALIFAAECGTDYDKVVLNTNLYYKTNLDTIMDILDGIHEAIDSVTLFGHNPSFTDIVNSLCRDGCDFIPKSGVVCISYDVKTWNEISRNTGKLEYFLIPEK